MRWCTLGKKSPGFTIVELLIVIVVIGVLAAIATVAFVGIQGDAQDKVVLSDLETAERKIGIYQVQNNEIDAEAITWYSGDGSNSNIGFTPSGDNIIDVVADSDDYCIRVYNPHSANHKTLQTAATKGSSQTACSTLSPSIAATGLFYSQAFDTDLDDWSGTGVISRDTTQYHSSPAALCFTRVSGTSPFYAERVVDGLTIGADYRVNAYLLRSATSVTNGTLRIEEIGGTSPSFAGAADTWVATNYDFTATASSHTIRLRATFLGSSRFCIDDVQIVGQ